MRTGARLAVAVVCAIALNAGAADAYVYWTANSGAALGRADNNGSGVTHSFASATTANAIAVDGSYVYWGSGGSIGRANLDGSNPDPGWITGLTGTVTSIATDGTYIYWCDNSDYVGRALLSGSGVEPHFVNLGHLVDAMTVASGTMFLANGRQIYMAPADGSQSPMPFTGLVPGSSSTTVTGLAAANGDLYWSAITLGPTPGAIGAVAINETSAYNTFASGSFFTYGIATDGTYVYWTELASALGGPGEVYRAKLNGGLAITGTPDVFVNEPNAPTGVAVDGGIDSTTTTVSCSPAIVGTGQPSACTATVSDSASSSVPTGTVSFAGSGGAFFTGGPCQLAPLAGGGGASCSLGANLTVSGQQSITASYAGDAIHSGSSGSAMVCSGTSTQCGGGQSNPPPPPPPPATVCVVPKLKGKSLSTARSLLRKSHCELGKVRQPRRRKHHKLPKLLVGSSKPGTGTKLTDNAKVGLTLVAAPKHQRHKRSRRR